MCHSEHLSISMALERSSLESIISTVNRYYYCFPGLTIREELPEPHFQGEQLVRRETSVCLSNWRIASYCLVCLQEKWLVRWLSRCLWAKIHWIHQTRRSSLRGHWMPVSVFDLLSWDILEKTTRSLSVFYLLDTAQGARSRTGCCISSWATGTTWNPLAPPIMSSPFDTSKMVERNRGLIIPEYFIWLQTPFTKQNLQRSLRGFCLSIPPKRNNPSLTTRLVWPYRWLGDWDWDLLVWLMFTHFSELMLNSFRSLYSLCPSYPPNSTK